MSINSMEYKHVTISKTVFRIMIVFITISINSILWRILGKLGFYLGEGQHLGLCCHWVSMNFVLLIMTVFWENWSVFSYGVPTSPSLLSYPFLRTYSLQWFSGQICHFHSFHDSSRKFIVTCGSWLCNILVFLSPIYYCSQLNSRWPFNFWFQKYGKNPCLPFGVNKLKEQISWGTGCSFTKWGKTVTSETLIMGEI